MQISVQYTDLDLDYSCPQDLSQIVAKIVFLTSANKCIIVVAVLRSSSGTTSNIACNIITGLTDWDGIGLATMIFAEGIFEGTGKIESMNMYFIRLSHTIGGVPLQNLPQYAPFGHIVIPRCVRLVPNQGMLPLTRLVH